jgi:hypothetical protein
MPALRPKTGQPNRGEKNNNKVSAHDVVSSTKCHISFKKKKSFRAIRLTHGSLNIDKNN